MAEAAIWEVAVTCPDEATARALARAAVEARLAACANILPGGVESVYRWRGALAEDREVLLLLKTREALFEPLAALLAARHPYELPAITGQALRCAPALARWVAEETADPSAPSGAPAPGG